jgi:hypothetical protein
MSLEALQRNHERPLQIDDITDRTDAPMSMYRNNVFSVMQRIVSIISDFKDTSFKALGALGDYVSPQLVQTSRIQ